LFLVKKTKKTGLKKNKKTELYFSKNPGFSQPCIEPAKNNPLHIHCLLLVLVDYSQVYKW